MFVLYVFFLSHRAEFAKMAEKLEQEMHRKNRRCVLCVAMSVYLDDNDWLDSYILPVSLDVKVETTTRCSVAWAE